MARLFVRPEQAHLSADIELMEGVQGQGDLRAGAGVLEGEAALVAKARTLARDLAGEAVEPLLQQHAVPERQV